MKNNSHFKDLIKIFEDFQEEETGDSSESQSDSDKSGLIYPDSK